MKLIQINGWHGNLAPFLLPFIEKEAPDILCMQEVSFTEINTDKMAIMGSINYGTTISKNFNDYHFSPIFSYKILGLKVNFGNAIFSKYPLHYKKVSFVNRRYKSRQTLKKFTKNIVNVQSARIKLGGKELTVANTHGFHDINSLGNAQSVKVMARTAKELQNLQNPLLLCGDLNVNPKSEAIKELNPLNLRNLTVEAGVKTTLSPIHRAGHDVICDYIFASNDVEVKDFRLVDEIVSDHKALVLEFEP